jgi:hypothetical protein
MNANGLLPYDLFSWNKAKQESDIFEYGVKDSITIYKQNGNYSLWLHTPCSMGLLCHAGLFFQSSRLLHESVAPSSAAD